MPEVDIRLERVTKAFGDTVAVDDLSLDIEEGEFFSMLGPSGCGKTTTLRMIGGFDDPTRGTIYLGGRDVTDLPPYRRDVNTVFQSYALFPHLNVFENVAFGLRRKKVDKAEIERRVEESLELVDLVGFDQRKPAQMSGGQQQRVALARALVNRPKVLLLDEPLGALDLKLRKQMQLELKRIQQEVGITFIYVTHDQEEAMTMSNRLAVMRHGKAEQIGPPEDVYENPQTEFVASFLGASNLLEGELKEQRNGTSTVLLTGGDTVNLPSERAPFESGASVKVGVRPEKITIEPDDGQPPASGLNSVSGLLRMSTYIGVSHQYKVEGPGGTTLTVWVQNLGAIPAPHPGERVRCRGGRSTRSRSCRRRTWTRGGGGMMNEGTDRSLRDDALMDAIMRARLTRRGLLKGAGRGAAALGLASSWRRAPRRPRRPALDPEADLRRTARGQDQLRQLAPVHRLHEGQGRQPLHPVPAGLHQADRDRRSTSRKSIQSNAEFFGKLQPQLQAGQDTGWDIIVITNGRYFTALVENELGLPARPVEAPELRPARGQVGQGPRRTTRATSTRWPGSRGSPGSA